MQSLIDAVKLAYQQDSERVQSLGWSLKRAARGLNGIVYQAVSEDQTLAVKVSARDSRQRSAREYSSMRSLWASGIEDVCPYPISVYENINDLPGDILIMTWLEGDRLEHAPPPDDRDCWTAILKALSAVHRLKPEISTIRLRHSVDSVYHPEDYFAHLRRRRANIPDGTHGMLTPDKIDALLQNAASKLPLRWNHQPATSLILCDANCNNMIYHQGRIRLVDWANSGWSDPAFDIADLNTQPRYLELPDAHREWIRETHGRLLGDRTLPERAHTYETLLYILWVIIHTVSLTRARPQKLPGIEMPSREYHLHYQKRYWERVWERL